MNFKDQLKTTFSALKMNKWRSALTILGIVIGISAVITAMAVGYGAEHMILNQIASLGSNNIFIEPGAWSERMERGSMMQSMAEEMEIKTLTYDDAEALEKLPSVELTVPYVYGVARAVYKNKNEKITFLGTNENSKELTDEVCVLGRNLDSSDVKSMARVVVLGHETRKDLFGDANPVGEMVRIKRSNFRVIGVLEKKGPQAFLDIDTSMYIPLTTAQNLLTGEKHLRFIVAKAKNEDLIPLAISEIRSLLRDRHGIHNPEGDPARDDFKVMSQEDTAEIVGNVTGIFTVLLSSIAAISLVVGGVGIMNIMLVSVTERTREIGLRKAVGAKSKDILNQFLLESVLLTVAGGILGVISGSFFSWLASLAFGYFLGDSWGFILPLNAVGLGIGISFLTGLVFGLYPAKKAAKLSPIEALRYE